MYGGYNVGFGPATYHNGAIYSDPRIAMYLGMGLHQMPGDVWWRTWRTLPPKQCSTDPDFSWQGQAPGGHWTTIHDPLSGKDFRVWEGHYTYPGTSLKYLPTWAGGMFEGLDGRPGRARDDVGTAQLRPRRPAHRTGADQVRDAAARRQGVGHVAVEHRRRLRRLRRVRRAGPCLPDRSAAVAERVAGPEPGDDGDAARVVPRTGRRPAAGLREHRTAAPALPGQSTPRTAASTTRSTRPPAPSGIAVWCSTSR